MTVQQKLHLRGTICLKANRPFLWLTASLLIATGCLTQASELNSDWMIWAHRQEWFPGQFWLFATQWGDSAQALVLMMALFLKTPVELAMAMKTWILGSVTATLLKSLLVSPRPISVLDPQLLTLIGHPPSISHAMPSGHAMAAGALAAMLFMALQTERRWLRAVVLVICATVALSRVAVGAHWPGDVLVGSGLGCALALLAQRWERIQPWSGYLSSLHAQTLLSLLMVLLVGAIWLPPSEGLGMVTARWLALLLTFVSVAGVYKRWFLSQSNHQGRNAG